MLQQIVNRKIDYCNTGWDIISTDALHRLFLDLNITTDPHDFSLISAGSLNKLFTTNFADRENFVVKISPSWNNIGLARENWCYTLLKSFTTLRLPTVYSYLPNDNSYLNGHEILILEKIQGRHLKEADLSSAQINQQLSVILSQIHQIDGNGYGWLFGIIPKAECETWLDFICKLENTHLTLLHSQITQDEIDFLHLNFLRYADWPLQSKLLYGDMNNENLLVHDAQIVPIDFQNCFYGDPLYDLGIMLFFNPSLLNYLSYFHIDSTFNKKKVILYAMRHCINTLGHRCAIKNSVGIHESETKYFMFKKLFLEQ